MTKSKKFNRILIIIILLILAIVAVLIILFHKGILGGSSDSAQPDTGLIDSDSTQGDHITDPYSIVQSLLDPDSADPTIRELSTIYNALAAGDTSSAGDALANLDPSSLEGDIAIFYYYDFYLYNSAVGDYDSAGSAKVEIDTIDKNRDL